MEKIKLTPEMLEIISSNNGLKMYLKSLSDDVEFTPRTELYDLDSVEKLTPDEILSRWKDKLEGLATGTEFEKEVFQFDSDQLGKWGPQGGHEPEEELEAEIILPSFEKSSTPVAFSSPEWKQAKQMVWQYLSAHHIYGLRPASYRSVIDDMRARDTLVSNSGWPLFTKRHLPNVITQSIQEAEDGRWETYPAIALFRRYHGKTRLVWMYPMSANLVEGSFFQPLQSTMMNVDALASTFLAPWKGFEAVRARVTEAYSSIDPLGYLAASDFSSTDAHFKLAASMEVCDVIEQCFQKQYRDALRNSIRAMHTIPLIVNADYMIVGEHGVSSGSNWTNFIETIFDWIFGNYVYLREASEGNEDSYGGFYAIGDDMAWATTHYDDDFARRLQEYGEEVGQLIKADKTTNDPDKVKSLQRLFQRGYSRPNGQIKAVYSTIRALNSLVYPERFHSKEREGWSKDMAAVRAFMILENCVDHPMFEDFCRFVVAGDPNIRTVSHLSTHSLDRLQAQSKHVRALNSTYNQEKRDSRLSQFESVKFISTL